MTGIFCLVMFIQIIIQFFPLWIVLSQYVPCGTYAFNGDQCVKLFSQSCDYIIIILSWDAFMTASAPNTQSSLYAKTVLLCSEI